MLKKVLGENKEEIWMTNPTNNSIPLVTERRLQLKALRKRETIFVEIGKLN